MVGNSNDIKNEIKSCINDIEVIGIDGVQFFDDNIILFSKISQI